MTNSESHPFDRLRINSIIIRYVPPKRDHLSSLIRFQSSARGPV
jgi:hypothetical protein